MKTPDFIIIGAMKCGTTTLASQLGAQDGLFMTDPKEPNFFSDDDIYAKGSGWYSALFDSAAPGDILGEASTHYTKLPTHPKVIERMTAAIAAPRLIYMIRNPVDRLVSHFIHEWSQGVLAGSASIEEAVAQHGPLIDYSRYAYQIAPFIEAYGREAILLTSLERLKADRNGELVRIAAHIGHEGPVAWHEENEAENVSSQRSRKLPFHSVIVDSAVATAVRRTLVPKSVRTWVRKARMMKERPSLPESLKLHLQDRFAEDREALARIFPEDPSLTLAYPYLSS